MRYLLILAIIIAIPASAVELDYLEVVDLDNQLIEHDYFNLSYNNEYNQPNWVVYRLTKELREGKGDFEKKVYCKRDTLIINDNVVTNDDYKNQVDFDAGHLIPRDDMEFDEDAYNAIMLMSVICPQYPSFNRPGGPWYELEDRVRGWAEIFGEIYIISGPIFDESPEKITVNRKKGRDVAIPDKYFKVVMAMTPELSAIGFLFPHINEGLKEGEGIIDYVKSVDTIEETTGFEFFSGLPDFIEDEYKGEPGIEGRIDFDKWFPEEMNEEIEGETDE